jgi:uncharacterized Tic20 family protein
MENTTEKNIATFTHYVLQLYFIPFGNYIFPIILWSSKRKSEFSWKASVEFSIEYCTLLSWRLSQFNFNIYHFNNVSLDAVINNDNFVVNNFNCDQIGLITVGLTAVFILVV